jgi:hypothetical protein
MDFYLIGVLFGRFLASYAVVWILLWIISKFDWRSAFRRSYRWYGLVSIAAIYAIGIVAMFTW